jgi:hypothetical protein
MAPPNRNSLAESMSRNILAPMDAPDSVGYPAHDLQVLRRDQPN